MGRVLTGVLNLVMLSPPKGPYESYIGCIAALLVFQLLEMAQLDKYVPAFE